MLYLFILMYFFINYSFYLKRVFNLFFLIYEFVKLPINTLHYYLYIILLESLLLKCVQHIYFIFIFLIIMYIIFTKNIIANADLIMCKKNTLIKISHNYFGISPIILCEYILSRKIIFTQKYYS
jgi:hypothetical protein